MHCSPSMFRLPNTHTQNNRGSDEPCALGHVYSIGCINQENNGKITAGITDVLEEFGVKGTSMYISFFDMPRENIGFNKKTIAG